jgi:hypothetical protein
MSYAPAALNALARYWVAQHGVNLGIVGDSSHQDKGTSYHLGKDHLTLTAYSRQTPRDRAGLTNAASAIDLGKLKASYGELRSFSSWLVQQCRKNAPGTADIREIIYSPDGRTVKRYDRERGFASAPVAEPQLSKDHLWHTHISFYRDSEKRDKTVIFRPYFAPLPAPAFRVRIKPGAKIRVYTLGDETDGNVHCIDTWEKPDRVWTNPWSSAPCGAKVPRKTCDGKSSATTALVSAGAFKGQHIRVGARYGVYHEAIPDE